MPHRTREAQCYLRLVDASELDYRGTSTDLPTEEYTLARLELGATPRETPILVEGQVWDAHCDMPSVRRRFGRHRSDYIHFGVFASSPDGIANSSSFAYPAAVAAAYRCHRLCLCKSVYSQMPRITEHGKLSINPDASISKQITFSVAA